MAITNKTTLIAAIQGYLNRNDLASAAEDFIDLAEARFNRDARIRNPDGANTRIVPLSAGTDTNWLLTNYPDIYLYGSLIESAPYLRDDQRIGLWQSEYDRRADELAGSIRTDPTRTLDYDDYAGLQRMVADTLNRGDMENVIPVLILQAERVLDNDYRVRNLEETDLTINAEEISLPAGTKQIESLYLDTDATRYEIDIVPAGELADVKARQDASGAPTHAALVDDATLRFGPVPDGTYTGKLSYWQGVTALSAGSNWLFTDHPHIYLYATLVEAMGWLNQDPTWWATKLEAALEGIHVANWDAQWGGSLRKQYSPIG